MVTISLDEYGEFEKEEKKPLFVGGLMFDDQEVAGEERTERQRIEAFYRRAIADAGDGLRYPNDLHSNGNRKRDSRVIGPVKEQVRKSMPEFLMKGTYAGEKLTDSRGMALPQRQGKYHLFVILKSDDGKRSLLVKNANMLARDDHAANRYFHMAGTVVNRIIFHNPIFAGHQIPPLNLDIATRSTGNLAEMDEETRQEFEEQSYRQKQIGKEVFSYSIMNQDIYRTLIAQEMVDSKKTKIRIEKLEVRSIQYRESAKDMEFLYMADSLCSILAYRLTGESADDWLEQIRERVIRLNSDEGNLVLAYDEIDNDFAEAWDCYERHDLFQALSICYDARRKTGKFAEHYKETWFPFLERRARATVRAEYFTRGVNELGSMLMTNNLDQEKLLYMMAQFEQMIPYVEKQYRSTEKLAEVIYQLYEAGVTAFCHIGRPKMAMEYYKKCRDYAFYAGVDAYLRTSRKLAVCLEDSFEWDEAEKLAEETLENQKQASELKRSILRVSGEHAFLDEARSLSQLARIQAEKRLPEAEENFRKALSMLEHASANYKITQSYLLHYYADMGMKEKFEEEAEDYFDGRKTYRQRYQYLMKMDHDSLSLFSLDYALYVLVRGYWLFGMEDQGDRFWEKVKKIPEDVRELRHRNPGGHPWELIYKYLEMAAIRRQDAEAEETFRKLRKSCLHDQGEITEAIQLFSDLETAEYKGDFRSVEEKSRELAAHMKENFSSLKQVEFPEEGKERYEELKHYFTFMYR